MTDDTKTSEQKTADEEAKRAAFMAVQAQTIEAAKRLTIEDVAAMLPPIYPAESK